MPSPLSDPNSNPNSIATPAAPSVSEKQPSAAISPGCAADKLPRLTPRTKKPNGISNAAAPSTANPSPIPAPVTPALPNPLRPGPSHSFVSPTRRILSARDHALFQASPTHSLLVAFIFSLSESVAHTRTRAVAGRPRSALHPAVAGILSVLETIEDEGLAAHPADDNGGSRFGNPAFRGFVDGIVARMSEWHGRVGVRDPAAVAECAAYLRQAFGSRARIDYGSGHELNFWVWVLCLYQLGLFPMPSNKESKNDSSEEPDEGTAVAQSLVLVVFPTYLRLMRKIQTTYYLEPAGSHGVWGLDDYQFLPFLFGASQLLAHAYIRPKSIHSALALEEGAPDFLYLDQVAFVNSVKSVEGLRWHSPMLDDISAARSWDKIEAGMRKMFVNEVLGKLPVMQHFMFGSLVPAADGMSAGDEGEDAAEERVASGEAADSDEGRVVVHDDQDGVRHVHQASSWGDCCGIRVPSSAGAVGEMKKRMGTQGGLRRLPFD
ncbi:serine/threonine-protein phosphatase 2A activator 2 [Phyllosticta citribraziliensis]|uniref:Serine/threonine-protein phosphatase 2A activator n=1 Tax=Phyllosticta citribraziliensis TaxID=989973 RepID=A0ABR1L4H2_9PEZI